MGKEMFKIVVDSGKPTEETANSEAELEKILKAIYEQYKADIKADNCPYLDVFVFNERGEDISESQFISEIIADILNEDSEADSEE